MKQKTVFTCQNCAAQSPKWVGKCSECGSWNTYVEETYKESSPQSLRLNTQNFSASELISKPLSLNEIKAEEKDRTKTYFQEFDRVLGGGIVQGSLTLIGGDPGIGKSTLLMQGFVPNKNSTTSTKILYVSGEESAHQIKMRAERLNYSSEEFLIYAENQLENILEQAQKIKPSILVIDSIQTVFSGQITSAAGSVSQVRECTGKLMMLSKGLGISTFIIGHVTKEGNIAGPKVLEHMVDTVLYFEGSNHLSYRILRAVKNRFGSTNELGVFEMTQAGLREVTNPSELFLQERPEEAAGTCVISTIEGSRPLLVEVQALVSQSQLQMPRRTALGIDQQKVSLILAVIEKKLNLPLYGHDVFVNVAGGLHIEEPAADLGVALALISSFKNRPLDSKLIVCGEIGLTGEIRRVSQLEQRLIEAARLGFEKAIVPKNSLKDLKKSQQSSIKLSLQGISTLSECLDLF